MKKENIEKHLAHLKAQLSRGSKFKEWFFRYLYNILYITLLFVLWLYIILNWKRCISMQFFSQFDGNNILFLVGIALVILPFYDLEGKGFKLHRRGAKETMEKLQELDLSYQLEKRKEGVAIATHEISKNQMGEASQNE